MTTKQEFKITCSNAQVIETEKYLYKNCPFGQLRYWKKSKRISIAKI